MNVSHKMAHPPKAQATFIALGGMRVLAEEKVMSSKKIQVLFKSFITPKRFKKPCQLFSETTTCLMSMPKLPRGIFSKPCALPPSRSYYKENN